jgi:hypothetical protein
VPTEYDDVHTPENIPEVKIQKPYEEEYVYKSDEKIVTDLDIESEFKINRVDYFINSVLIGSSASKPFQISFIPSETKEVVEGKNDIRVVVTDEVYNKSEAQSEFTVEF